MNETPFIKHYCTKIIIKKIIENNNSVVKISQIDINNIKISLILL